MRIDVPTQKKVRLNAKYRIQIPTTQSRADQL